jgi:hypothetical protein
VERFLAAGTADPDSGQELVALERHDSGVSLDDDSLVRFDSIDEVARHARCEVRAPDHDRDRTSCVGEK